MIADRIERLAFHFPQLKSVTKFVGRIDDSIPEGMHEIEGETAFALVSRYETKPEAGAMPEAHRRYVDIQFLLAGQENIIWWPLHGLVESVPYDEKRDISFYAQPSEPGTRVALSKGVFAAFMPQDAHMPQIAAQGGPQQVTKVVIKVDARLLGLTGTTS